MLGQPAGDDGVVPAEVGRAVQREAVQGHPGPHDPYTDGAGLSVSRPDAGVDAVAPKSPDARVGARAYDHLLELADVPDHVGLRPQIDDRISHELPGPVEGDAAASVHEMQLGPGRLHLGLGPPEMLRLPALPARVDGGGLQKA